MPSRVAEARELERIAEPGLRRPRFGDGGNDGGTIFSGASTEFLRQRLVPLYRHRDLVHARLHSKKEIRLPNEFGSNRVTIAGEAWRANCLPSPRGSSRCGEIAFRPGPCAGNEMPYAVPGKAKGARLVLHGSPVHLSGANCYYLPHKSRAMADRITQFVAEAKRADWAKQISANDNLAKQLTDLVARSKDDPDLDHAAGQAAYDAARAPFDGASTLGGPEQLKMWQAEPQISKRCLDVVNFVDANLATRADERDKKSRDN